jgi:hypothetical protein
MGVFCDGDVGFILWWLGVIFDGRSLAAAAKFLPILSIKSIDYKIF